MRDSCPCFDLLRVTCVVFWPLDDFGGVRCIVGIYSWVMGDIEHVWWDHGWLERSKENAGRGGTCIACDDGEALGLVHVGPMGLESMMLGSHQSDGDRTPPK